MQTNAETKVQSIALLQEAEKTFSAGGDMFILDTGKVYPFCADERIRFLEISDLEDIVYENSGILNEVRYYAKKVLPFLMEDQPEGLLVIEDEGMIPDKRQLGKVFNIHVADYQEIISVISLLNRRPRRETKKRKTYSDTDELLIVELYERSSECLKKGGKIFIKGNADNYPPCRSRNIEFADAEKVDEITGGNMIRARIREFFARHIYWSVVPPWNYVPKVVVFEAVEIEGTIGIRRRSFYQYKVRRRIISEVLKKL